MKMLELNKENFDVEVLQTSQTVFVDFYGDGCEPCKALMPFVHSMSEKYEKGLKFAALNTTQARRLAISQRVLGLPVMAIYKNGEKVAELIKDDCTEANIEKMIKDYMDEKW